MHTIRENLDYFHGFVAHGNLGSAVVYLADIYFLLPHLPTRQAAEAEAELELIGITPELISAAHREINERIDKIDRITSIGSRWDADEIVLLLLMRIEIDVLLSFLVTFGVSPDVDLREIDHWFEQVPTSVEHKSSFASAATLIRRNSASAQFSSWV